MILLVCGGRDFTDRDFVFRMLDTVHARSPVTRVIHGDAMGADTLAGEWATVRSVDVRHYPVTLDEWRTIGKAAGPLRNARMLREGKPDLVVAFPGGRGTDDMVRQAKAARVPVIRVSEGCVATWHPDGSLFR